MPNNSHRVIVLGGLGLFGRTAVEQLRALGIAVQTASRGGGAELRVDANDRQSIRNVLRRGDLVVDAAGPFYKRSIALVEAAIEVGFDVIDLNEDLGYAERILALEPQVQATGIRVLSSASSVSAVSVAIIAASGVGEPARVSAFLAPATRSTANAGAALSLLRSVGQPIRVFRDGRLRSVRGWSEARQFTMPPPIGSIHGRLFESADAIYLPRIWPSLRDVAMYVDTNLPAANTLLRVAARWPVARRAMEQWVHLGARVVRRLGSMAGGIGYEIEGGEGQVRRFSIVSAANSFVVAVAPAVLAAQAIVEGQFEYVGLVPPHLHVEPGRLIAYLQARGIALVESR